MYRVERDWYGLAEQIERETDRKNQARLKKDLRDTMLQSAELFKIKPFFLSDEFSRRRRHDRAHHLAHAPLRDRPAAAGAGHGEIRGVDARAPLVARQPVGRRNRDGLSVNRPLMDER